MAAAQAYGECLPVSCWLLQQSRLRLLMIVFWKDQVNRIASLSDTQLGLISDVSQETARLWASGINTVEDTWDLQRPSRSGEGVRDEAGRIIEESSRQESKTYRISRRWRWALQSLERWYYSKKVSSVGLFIDKSSSDWRILLQHIRKRVFAIDRVPRQFLTRPSKLIWITQFANRRGFKGFWEETRRYEEESAPLVFSKYRVMLSVVALSKCNYIKICCRKETKYIRPAKR